MIDVRVKITDYDKDRNTHTAKLQNGNKVEIDFYVGCAIILTDEDYQFGKGFDIVGNTYILTEYSVYKDNIVPHDNGIILIKEEEQK